MDMVSCIYDDIKGVRQEIWHNITSPGSLDDLTTDSRYPDNPSIATKIDTFEVPSNYGNRYGQRLTAYLLLSVSGYYGFLCSCNWLCNVTLTTSSSRVIMGLQTIGSTVAHLDKNTPYFLDVIHSEGVGNDWMELNWKIPGSQTWSRIPRDNLIIYNPRKSAAIWNTFVHLLGEWQPWQPCSTSCGEGHVTRRRSCAANPPIVVVNTNVSVKAWNESRSCANYSSCSGDIGLPENITAYNSSSTSVIVSWTLMTSPPNITYHVTLNSTDDVIVVNVTKPWVEFTGLKKFTTHCARVLAMSDKGSGNASKCFYVTTDEDVPDRPPSSVRIIPISPWSGKVTWSRVPSSHANGIVIGYKIIAKSVNSSSYIQLISFPSTNYSGVVLGLNASTTYCFRMLAFTRIGDGNVSDCVMVTTQQHVPCPCQSNPVIRYSSKPPYFIITTHQSHPSGLIPRALNGIMGHVCRACRNFSFTYVYSNQSELFEETADFYLPTRDNNVPIGMVYVPVVKVPGFVLFRDYKSPMMYARKLAWSVFNCWPLFIINISMAFLSGILIWIMDCSRNNDHFPISFVKGAQEAFWWSFVTMTTIGYGDRVPRSPAGRVLSVVWSLVGIVLISLLTSALTTSLTVTVIIQDIVIEKGLEIGYIDISIEQKIANQLCVANKSGFSSAQELYKALRNSHIDAAILDMHTAWFYKHLFCKFKQTNIIHEFTYGFLADSNARTLLPYIHKHIQSASMNVMQYLHQMQDDKNQKEKIQDLSALSQIDFLDPSNDIFLLVMILMSTCLVLAVVCGVCYIEMQKRAVIITTESFVLIYQYKETIRAMRSVLEKFYNDVQRTHHLLKAKHRKELRDLTLAKKKRTQMEKSTSQLYCC